LQKQRLLDKLYAKNETQALIEKISQH